MRIIGIDPGTQNVGYAIVEDGPERRLCACGTLAGGKAEALPQRLLQLHDGLTEVLGVWQPAAAAVETVFFGKNSKTAIAVGEGRGVALLALARAEVEIIGYEPALVKKSVCGNGRASKRQVIASVQGVLGLSAPPGTDHEADAIALALCHINRSRLGLGTGDRRALPPAVLEAMGGAPPRRRRGSKHLS